MSTAPRIAPATSFLVPNGRAVADIAAPTINTYRKCSRWSDGGVADAIRDAILP